MDRSVAFIVTGLSAAPLLALAGFALTSKITPRGPGSDSSIAAAYLSVLVAPTLGKYLLVVDAALLIAGLLSWRTLMAEPPRLAYDGHTPVHQVEARIPKTLLGGTPVDAASIDFTGGENASVPHPDAAREDGDAMILPWETTPIRLKAWEVRVFVRDTPSLFALPLPAKPARSTQWSEWLRAVAREGSTMPDGLTLRYRFLLRPHGS